MKRSIMPIHSPPTSCSKCLAIVLIALSLSFAQSAAAEQGDGEYTLRWADEFDINGPPSPDNWGFESGFVRNREAQWYQPENAWCEKGLLIIEGRREKRAVEPHESYRSPPGWARNRTHAQYTSSSLNTRGKHHWLYGRFVMRAKIPSRPGAWPAFWTLGHGKWPACGEIDVMEYYDEKLLANAAWLGAGGKPKWNARKTPITDFGDPSWRLKFHEYRMDWDADSIRIYVDETLVNQIDIDATHNADEEGANPFRKPHYLLVNLAIGGVHGGDPSDTAFPIRYEIDYVRVYQRNGAHIRNAATASPTTPVAR